MAPSSATAEALASEASSLTGNGEYAPLRPEEAAHSAWNPEAERIWRSAEEAIREEELEDGDPVPAPPGSRIEILHNRRDCLVLQLNPLSPALLIAGALPGLLFLAGLAWLLRGGSLPVEAGGSLVLLSAFWLVPPAMGVASLLSHFSQREVLVLRRGEISQDRKGLGGDRLQHWRFGHIMPSTLAHHFGSSLALYADGSERIELGLMLRGEEYRWLRERVLERTNA